MRDSYTADAAGGSGGGQSTEVHKPFIPLFLVEDEAEHAALRGTLAQRFHWIASKIEGDFLFGDRVTGADAFLYVMLRWSAIVGLETPRSFEGFVEAAGRRSSVKAVLAAEGLQSLCAAAAPLPAT